MLTAEQIVRIERHEPGDGLAALTFAPPEIASALDPQAPLVFVLHGLGARKERHLDLCLRLARAGFVACMYDAPHHGERRTETAAALSGPPTTLEFAHAFADTVQGTVRDAQILASYFGRQRYGVVGHSMGGFSATHLAIRDVRAVVIVNISGSIDVTPPPNLAVEPEIVNAYAEADPAGRAASIAPRPYLIVQGADDTIVLAAGAQRLYEAARPGYRDAPARLRLDILPGIGHDWNEDIAARAVGWLTQWRDEIVSGT